MSQRETGNPGHPLPIKRLVVISGSEATRKELASQMEELFENSVSVESYALDNGLTPKIDQAIVLVTSSLILNECKHLIEDSCRIIVAKRTLNFQHLDKLYSMPRNTSLLIVNGSKQTAYALIDQLKGIGFINFDYYAYFPGHMLTRKKFDFVITPGETKLIPFGHSNVIDIGSRIFDITTIIDAAKSLDILDSRIQEKVNKISSGYMRKIISLGQELNIKHENLKSLNDFLLKIINSVNDGILVYSKSGNIELVNIIATHLLHLGEGDNLLEEAHKINPKLCDYLFNDSIETHILHVNNLAYLFSKTLTASNESYLLTIKNVRERISMENQLKKELKKQGYKAKYAFSDLIYKSTVMRDLIVKAKKLSESEFNILIYGESGTGKELFASAMHNASKRKNGPFFAINCSALPDELIESELFGYEEGAFTGARKGGKTGFFELANHGTLFLDEIGDISPKIQSRLLRVLQENEILRLGGSRNIPIDVRIVVATNKDLLEMVRQGKFREDLYYRLNKLCVHVPPLRERREDIELLFKYFIIKKNGFDVKITGDAQRIIESYDWPGNVRELENNVEYILAVRENNWIDHSDLPESLSRKAKMVIDPDDKLVSFILQTIMIFNQKNMPIGRIKLYELSREAQFNVSELQIRKVLGWMSDKGFVQIGRGRLGLRLTAAASPLYSNPT